MDNELATNSNDEQVINVVSKKEKRAIVKKMWDKTVDANLTVRKIHLKAIPMALTVTSFFAPEAAPVLLGIKGFLASSSGKKLMNAVSLGDEAIASALKGDFEASKENLKEGVQIFIKDEDGKIVSDVRNLIINTKEESKGMAM